MRWLFALCVCDCLLMPHAGSFGIFSFQPDCRGLDTFDGSMLTVLGRCHVITIRCVLARNSVLRGAHRLLALHNCHYSTSSRAAQSDGGGLTQQRVVQVVMGYTRGWQPEVVVTLANAVGAATAMRQGAGRNVAARQTVERLLTEGGARSNDGHAADCREALALLTRS